MGNTLLSVEPAAEKSEPPPPNAAQRHLTLPWVTLILFAIGAAIGAATTKWIDAWNLRNRPASFTADSLHTALRHSEVLADALLEMPNFSSQHLDRLIELTRRARRDMSTEEAKSILLLDLVDLGLASQYVKIAESNDRQINHLKPETGKVTSGKPDVIAILERSSAQNRARATTFITRLQCRAKPACRPYQIPVEMKAAADIPLQPPSSESASRPKP